MMRLLLSTLMLIFFGSMASAQDSYKIQPGDVLTIEVLEDASLNRNTLVLPDGTVTFPLVGSIAAGGQTLAALQGAIVSALTPNFASPPNVFVTIQSIIPPAPAAVSSAATVDIFVMGAVNGPGKYEATHGTTLLQFLAESGGFTKFAAKKRIQLRRINATTGQAEIFKLNFHAVENGLATPPTIVLQSGDVIIVPERRLFE